VKTEDFIVSKRPRLAEIRDFPEISVANFERRLRALQERLQLVQQAYLGTAERAVVVLEGWDTAGKGGVVRRLGWALDPRSFKVHPIAAPSSHEKSQHYLQRFWEKLPPFDPVGAPKGWERRSIHCRKHGAGVNADKNVLRTDQLPDVWPSWAKYWQELGRPPR